MKVEKKEGVILAKSERHMGCHATCEKYISKKKIYEEEKKNERNMMHGKNELDRCKYGSI